MTAARRRLLSLDVFRGLTVAGMIVVNNPGNWRSIYWPLQHAMWNGYTPADLVFPFFMVIMGMALPFSLEGQSMRNRHSLEWWRRILTRTLILLTLGLLLNAVAAWPQVGEIRIPGVLQRIALAYACTAPLLSRVSPRFQAVIGLALLAAHWALVVLVPFGGERAGIVTLSHNLPAWVDQGVFGTHLLTPAGDPEGLLGLLPSVATTLAGALVGRWILTHRDVRSPVPGLVVASAAGVVAGAAWSIVWPMNKWLWTGSYALFATGLALLAFAVCYRSVDASNGRARWAAPFAWLGINPLVLYFGSEMMGHLIEKPMFMQSHGVSLKDVVFWDWLAPMVGDGGGALSSLTFALAYVALWTIVAGLLHRARITLRV